MVVVTGIWPPDVGGPAVHGPELADHLVAAGHEVVVVTTADRAPAPRGYEVRWVPRRIPPGLRHVRAVAMVAAAARDADLVYAAGMVGRSGLAALIARRPIVVRLAADPAYERAVRRGLTHVPVEGFQRERGAQIALLRAVRDLALQRATRIVVPSRFLADVAAGWGISPARIAVLPNPVDPPVLDDREALRRRHGLDGPTLAFTGRFAPQKSLGVALDALARVEGVSLVLAGDGPERPGVEAMADRMGLASRVRFLGPQPRQAVFELLRAADAALLAPAGRTSRSPSSRRWPSARRSSQRRSAACPRSSRRGAMACSYRRTIPRRWPRPSHGSSATKGCVSASGPAQPSPPPATRRT